MKAKLISLFLSLILCLFLFSCGADTLDTESNAQEENKDTSLGNTDSSLGGENGGENGGEQNGGEQSAPQPAIGTDIGDKLPSFEAQMFDETGLLGEYIDPSALGKITVINFWGTWCPPCVNELPHFSEVATEYKDEVSIVAIHSVDNFTVNAVNHVNNNFKDSDIIFAKDINTGKGNIYYDECYEICGGKNYYPYTLVLDENGVITYKTFGAITKAKLISEIEKARG